MPKLTISRTQLTIKLTTMTEINLINKLIENNIAVHSNRAKTIHTVSIENFPEVAEILKLNLSAAQATTQEIYSEVLQRRSDTLTLLNTDFSELNDFLMPHQRLGREIAKVHDKFGFFYSVRAGKTPMLLQIMEDNPGTKWLVVCPLVLINNAWLEDAGRFFPGMSVVSLHASTKAKRLKQFEKDATKFIINTESFVAYEEQIRKLGITGVILDESSSLKSHSSKFAKAFTKFCSEMKKVYLLSGTPAPNGMHEYYKQVQCLDPLIIQQSYTQFEQAFFFNKSYNPQYKDLAILPDKEKLLKDVIAKKAIYVDAEDYFKFPGREFKTVNLEMPDNVKKVYKLMLKELYTEVDGLDITVPSAAAKCNKLRQISSGFVYDEEKQPHLIDMFKFNRLIELLGELGNKQVLIWANYRYEFEVIQQLLGDRCRVINGTVNIDQKNEAIKLFKSGKIQFLIANPASADKGLTLTNAFTCIYFSVGYSYELHHQSMARIYGGLHSQPNFCTYYMFEVKSSLDKLIYQTLNNKQDVSLAILNYIRIGGNDNA